MWCVSPYTALAHLCSLPKDEVYWVLADWPILPSIEVPVHRPGSSNGDSVGCSGRAGHPAETYSC